MAVLTVVGAALLVWWLVLGHDPAADAQAAIRAACSETNDFDITAHVAVINSGVREASGTVNIRVSGQDFHMTADDEDGYELEFIKVGGVTYGRHEVEQAEWTILPHSMSPLLLYADGDICASPAGGASGATGAGFSLIGNPTLNGIATRHYSAPAFGDQSWEIWIDANDRLAQTRLTRPSDGYILELRSVYSGHGESNTITSPVASAQPTPEPTATPLPAPPTADPCVENIGTLTSTAWSARVWLDGECRGGTLSNARFYTFTLAERSTVLISLEPERSTNQRSFSLYLREGAAKEGPAISSATRPTGRTTMALTLAPGVYTLEGGVGAGRPTAVFRITIVA